MPNANTRQLRALQKQAFLDRRVNNLLAPVYRQMIALQAELSDAKARIASLEHAEQRRVDEAGYAKYQDRYEGKHPSRCSCDRCLRRMFPRGV